MKSTLKLHFTLSRPTFSRGKRLTLFSAIIIFAIISVFGLSLITGNKDQSSIGTTLASAQEPADINSDGKVDVFDLSVLLGKWNTADTLSDLNKDGTVSVFDLSMLLAKWGAVNMNPTQSLLKSGLNDHPIWLRSSQDTAFDLIRQSNTESLRIDMPWDVIEPQDNQYNTMRLGLIDAYVDQAVAANIKILMVVTDSPSWATGSADRHAPPTSNDSYSDYLEFLMRRYGDKVEAYEIWNEPNGGWAWLNPDPVRYASLLKSAYTRAKSVDSTRLILAPSLSGPDQAAYLDSFYAQGTKDYFDAFSMHGYWWNLNGSVVLPYYNYSNPDQSIFGAFNTRILPVMTKYGDQTKRVWWTETGIATQGSVTNENDQANKVDEAFDAWYDGVIPTMDRLYWYTIIDSVGTGSEQNFGLVNLIGTSATVPAASDFAPKQAFVRYQAQALK
jgi:polysaccharide biosynthesis protein PslG